MTRSYDDIQGSNAWADQLKKGYIVFNKPFIPEFRERLTFSLGDLHHTLIQPSDSPRPHR